MQRDLRKSNIRSGEELWLPGLRQTGDLSEKLAGVLLRSAKRMSMDLILETGGSVEVLCLIASYKAVQREPRQLVDSFTGGCIWG